MWPGSRRGRTTPDPPILDERVRPFWSGLAFILLLFAACASRGDELRLAPGRSNTVANGIALLREGYGRVDLKRQEASKYLYS